MIKSEKAVSEVIGMVLILSIMVLVIGTIMLVGVPMIESSKNKAKMDVVANTFLSLQNDIEEAVRGPIWVRDPRDANITADTKLLGPSRETEFELMGGTLSVLPNRTNLSCIPVNCSITNASNFTVIIPQSNITYTADRDVIVYENGAVIRKYEAGEPLMVSDPLISIYNTGDNNITISIHAILINGTLSSVGGDGKAWVETRLKYYNETVEPQPPISPNLNQTNINMTTQYPEAWEAFFDTKLREAGLTRRWNRSIDTGYYISNETMPLEVWIYGYTNKSKDIFLSIYESKLDIKAR